MAEPASLSALEAAHPEPILRPVPDLPEPSARPPRPTPRLEIPTYDFAGAQRLERELGVSHVLAQILARRGMTDPVGARAFLEAQERHDPAAFDGIDRAVSAIQAHLARGTRIAVHGDYDVDGVCATAVLVRALRSLGANVGWFLPDRLADGYGLSSATVDRLAARDVRLLVTVDCGITAVEEVARAQAAGLETVITDHHAPRADGSLPACPIVHPAVCGYPCPDLCGTAVAFKLAQALGAPTTADDLELVALATVADLMPLRGENRDLVRAGLRTMANTAKPGLRALMEVARVDPSALDAHALGFRLAPRINASGRMRRPDAGLELLLTEDRARAAEIAAELDAVNVERRAVEERTTWEAEAQVARLGERSSYVLCGEGWHPGVIGIVASRIVERHHRPAILVALNEGPFGQGSGRSIPGFDLLQALHAAAPELERYGGHRAAAGLTVARDRLAGLVDAIERHAASVLTPEMLEPVERVDAIVSGTELGVPLAEELRALEPCGIGNPGPRLLIPGGRFSEQRAMGEGRHARFSVNSGGTRARAVAFGCDGRLPARSGHPVDATFRLERNEWRGLVEPRLVLRHAQPCSPAPIEVVGEPEAYLAGVLAELDATIPAADEDPRDAPTDRTVLDRRGASPLATLADAVSTGEPVLAVCADVSRRRSGLADRLGGFALACYHGLERQPALAASAEHLVALDPPASGTGGTLLQAGSGVTHLAWGEAELRFTWQMHELEYGLRTSLVTLFRSLRQRGGVAGEELEQLLRGDGQHGRPARLAGRLIRVLAELELVSLDRDLPALTVTSEAPTELERSPAYRVYQQRHKDGLRSLSNAKLRPDG
ncbi:MAG TPA: single-stranded-DNA-specific exonuclease RecJ [Solirubrobacteraceae bacterium]